MKIKKYLIDGLKGSIYFYCSLILIASVLSLMGININVDTNKLIGVNLLTVEISKEAWHYTGNTLFSVIVFFTCSIGSYIKNKFIS